MYKIFLIFLLVVLFGSIQCQDDKTKLATYIGIGYDIFFGNPYTDRIDPGFRVPIFNLTFEKKQTTTDQIHSIPDGSNAIEKRSCSYIQTAHEVIIIIVLKNNIISYWKIIFLIVIFIMIYNMHLYLFQFCCYLVHRHK